MDRNTFFLVLCYCTHIHSTFVLFLCIITVVTEKITTKYACREKECPEEMTSQSFPVSCFHLRGFVVPRKWNFTFSVAQNTGKKNHYQIIFLLSLTVHCLDFIKQIKKETCFTFTLNFNNNHPILSRPLEHWERRSYNTVQEQRFLSVIL